ncbi:hypothetical protein QE152_g8778 [Popillia japonica]|uniref:Uncharacterized protein n=1 Tax=Popillia japonica TaxID=7064 RepID=A0AAW1LWZ6_POPJA
MNKVGEVDIFLNSYDEKVHVVALTKHWLTADGMSGMCLNDYVLASSFCRAERQHGGSCIFVADRVPFVEMTNLRQKSIEKVVECSSVYIPKYSMLIINIDWSSIMNDCDADTCYNNLLEVIMNKFNNICPKKVARNRNDI